MRYGIYKHPYSVGLGLLWTKEGFHGVKLRLWRYELWCNAGNVENSDALVWEHFRLTTERIVAPLRCRVSELEHWKASVLSYWDY